MEAIIQTLAKLAEDGNLRRLPADSVSAPLVDLSSNDYLGLAGDIELREKFLAGLHADNLMMTSSASRLLSASQNPYIELEARLAQLYGREALLFNSGYHANTGLVSALGGKNTLFVADKLVHASIIDGLMLSGSHFERYRHNDYEHLRRILEKHASGYERVVIVSESVFSMDGDSCDIARLVEAKKLHHNALLYVDEAHAVGVCGPQGLGLSMASGLAEDVDITVGTFGKALASSGAFAVLSPELKEFMVNKARSLIFSTAIPPVCARWSLATLEKSLGMDAERKHLRHLGKLLSGITRSGSESHIQPLIVGDARAAVELSQRLAADGFKVLPIRKPTVPAGTERLRFSLSTSLAEDSLNRLQEIMLKYS